MYSVTIKILGLEDLFVFESMTGHEELSRLSSYDLSCPKSTTYKQSLF